MLIVMNIIVSNQHIFFLVCISFSWNLSYNSSLLLWPALRSLLLHQKNFIYVDKSSELQNIYATQQQKDYFSVL